MGKTYIDIVKYMVEAQFNISGLVERPDIIGAVFGQTEGLLGGGLDLKELQKNGKIGRIEIEAAPSGNRTTGRLLLPSSLGRVETCILGAAIESVDRVGPFETTFKVEKIEDTRNAKRHKIINRAKDLLKTLITTELPDSKEISELVESDVKSSVVTTYGPENLPAGPDVKDNNELILVEGRADVINLLKNDITNCVAVGGAIGTIPKTIIELSKSKETTLFVDGDRGGDMIIRGVTNVCDIDYIAKAPDGKEVEELTRKDIIKSLRSKAPLDQAMSSQHNGNHDRHDRDRRSRHDHSRFNRQDQNDRRQSRSFSPQQRPQETIPDTVMSPSDISRRMLGGESERHNNYGNRFDRQQEQHIPTNEMHIKDLRDTDDMPHQQSHSSSRSSEADPKFISALDELHNTLRGRAYDKSGSVLAEVPTSELLQTLQDKQGINTLVFDGVITQRLIELANKQGVNAVYGMRAGQISRLFDNVLLYTKDHGKL